MSGTKASGDQGEALAGRYLEARGYTILDRQWRCRFGELDIVARSPEGVLCFVEAKRRRRAANLYMGFHGLDCPARFDVAEVYEGKDGAFRVEYLEDAFA